MKNSSCLGEFCHDTYQELMTPTINLMIQNIIPFAANLEIKLMIIAGTCPEIIRLAAVMKRSREYFDTCIVYTNQNYDPNLSLVFWEDLELGGPDILLNVAGKNLGETCGNIISQTYDLMFSLKPSACLVLGDTNSCLSAINVKRLHIPVFHMEAGNRCKNIS